MKFSNVTLLTILFALLVIFSCNTTKEKENIITDKPVAYIYGKDTSAVVGTLVWGNVIPNCPPQGKPNPAVNGSTLTAREQNLNYHKNRISIPNEVNYVYSITMQQLFDSHDDSLAFSIDNGAAIIGYIMKGNQEVAESCNCYATSSSAYDTHIYLSPIPITNATKISDCMVMEITPYTRTLHPTWTTKYVNDSLAGKQVKVSGWLLYDYFHTGESIGTNPNTNSPQRQTVWEIHPIVAIEKL